MSTYHFHIKGVDFDADVLVPTDSNGCFDLNTIEIVNYDSFFDNPMSDEIKEEIREAVDRAITNRDYDLVMIGPDTLEESNYEK